MFNPWKHCRLASCVVLFLAQYLHNVKLLMFGIILVMTGLVGGIDLAERRIESLEKLLNKENADEKTDTN